MVYVNKDFLSFPHKYPMQYSHENPTSMSIDQQRTILDKTFRLLSDFIKQGKAHQERIVGSVAPWWETSKEGVELLLDYGIEYDHSAMGHDCQCYYLRDQGKYSILP